MLYRAESGSDKMKCGANSAGHGVDGLAFGGDWIT